MSEQDHRHGWPGESVTTHAPPDAHEIVLLAEPRVCRAGEGAAWLSRGWALFKAHWDVLCAIVVLQWLLSAVASLAPVVGNLAAIVLGPALSGGLLLALRMAESGGRPDVGMIFAGFTSPRFSALVMLGLASFLGMIALVVAVGVTAAAVFGAGYAFDASPDPREVWLGAFLVLVVFSFALFFYLAVFLFAGPLVLLHGAAVRDAMTLSLQGTMRNWASLSVYGLLGLGLTIATAFTFFLGLLVVGPLMVAAYYFGYRAIFTDDAPSSA